MRIGHGYDLHRLVADRPLILGGVRIPFEKVGVVDIANDPSTVRLPATGGIGTLPYILCGLILVFVPFVYGFGLRRRKERRSRE